MKFRLLSLGLAAGIAASTALPLTAAATQAASQPERKYQFSKEARELIVQLQAAVRAKEPTAIAAKLAAAKAAARTADDRFAIAQLQLQAANASKDNAAMAGAIEDMIASGSAQPGELRTLQLNLAKLRFGAKDHVRATAAAQQVVALEPGNTEALLLLTESLYAQGRKAEALSSLQRAIQTRSTPGQKAEEAWYKRAVGIAYEANSPATVGIARDWVAAYPSAASWTDALRLYRKQMKPDDSTLLDTLRLARATDALSGDVDFHAYAFTAVDAYAHLEAKSVIEEAGAAKKIDRSKALFKEIDAAIAEKTGNLSRESLLASAKEAQAENNARFAVRIADALYGIGEYARSAELFRAALAKPGADSNLINLRLGMALARAGDKAGATAAFAAVTGPRAELAKFWQVYLATRA